MKNFLKEYSNKKVAIFLVVAFFSWVNFLQAEKRELSIFDDPDGDGLSTAEELILGTDPYNADTDGDGYSDGVEVRSGFCPLTPAPGDRIVPETKLPQTDSVEVDGENINLTEVILQQLQTEKGDEIKLLQEAAETNQNISEVISNSGETVSLTESEIQSMIEKAIQEAGLANDKMELIPDEEVNILPAEEGEDVLAKEKKLVEEYFIQVAYIVTEDLGFISGSEGALVNELMGAVMGIGADIEQKDDTTVTELKDKSETMYEKIKELEVPYVLKDVHIMGLSLLKFLLGQNEGLVFDENDPAGLSLLIGKLEGSMMEADQLGVDVQSVLEQYDIQTFDFDSYIHESGFNTGVNIFD